MFRHLLFVFCLASPAAYSLPVSVIDFETFLDSQSVTNEYSGVLFTNALVLTAGISLNEFDFPPSSGQNVAMDYGGAMLLDFDQTANSFSAYFTYTSPLGIGFYDSSNMLVGTISSSGASNIGANEHLSYTNLTGFTSIRIQGDPAGGSFVVDDIRLTGAEVPEPGFYGVLLIGLAGLVACRRKV